MIAFSRRAAVAVLVGALAAGGAVAQTPAAPKPASVETGKLFKYLGLYHRLPADQKTLFTIAYFARVKGAKPSDVKIWTSQGAVPLAADGKLLKVPTADMLKRKEHIYFQAPKGASMNFDMALEALVPAAAEMDAARVNASVTQANKAIKGAVPLVGGMIPTMGRVVFHNAGSGQVTLANGGKSALPTAGGNVLYDLNAWPGARSFSFAKAPTRLFIEPAPKKKK